MKYLFYLLTASLLPVMASAAVGPITGTTTVCQSSVTSLTDATPGGTWSSSVPGIATVGTTGMVTGVAAGTSTITYSDGVTYATTTVTVNPLPVLTSTLTPPSVCDSGIFNYTPVSSVPDTAYYWSRPYISSLENPAGTGVNNPDEQLINLSALPVTVSYVYTLSGGGCINTQTVNVVVNPAPALIGPLTGSICSGSPFSFAAASATPGATITWTRAAVFGISAAASSGTGSISETLTDTIRVPVHVYYLYRLGAYSCFNMQNLVVTVNPCYLDVPRISSPGFALYPDPNNGTFTVYVPSAVSELVSVSITNMVGATVAELTATTNTSTGIRLDVSPGTYFLSAATSANKYYSKIIVTK